MWTQTAQMVGCGWWSPIHFEPCIPTQSESCEVLVNINASHSQSILQFQKGSTAHVYSKAVANTPKCSAVITPALTTKLKSPALTPTIKPSVHTVKHKHSLLIYGTSTSTSICFLIISPSGQKFLSTTHWKKHHYTSIFQSSG